MVDVIIVVLLVYVSTMLTLRQLAEDDEKHHKASGNYSSLATLEWRVDSISSDIKQLESEVRSIKEGVLIYD